jgi:hypothetical protein
MNHGGNWVCSTLSALNLRACPVFPSLYAIVSIFEAFLDSRILKYVEIEGKKGLSKKMCTRLLLYIILVGNLNFD